MNKKKNISIILIITLLSVALYFFIIKKNSTINKSEIDFAIEDTSSINKIIIYENNDTLILERKENYWKINNVFSAKNEEVTSLLTTLKLIDLKSPVPTNAQDYVKKLLLSSKKVEIYDNQKLIKSFYLGNLISDKSGNYMMLTNSENAYIMQIPALKTDIADKFSTNLKHWKDKNIFKYNLQEINYISLKYTYEPENSFVLVIDNQIKLLDFEKNEIENKNNENISRYLTYFNGVQFESFEPEYKIDSLKSEKSIFELEIKNKTNQSTKIIAYNIFENTIKNTDYFVAIINNEEVVKIKYFNFDLILKNIIFFGKK